jgi:hypothetical protein
LILFFTIHEPPQILVQVARVLIAVGLMGNTSSSSDDDDEYEAMTDKFSLIDTFLFKPSNDIVSSDT